MKRRKRPLYILFLIAAVYAITLILERPSQTTSEYAGQRRHEQLAEAFRTGRSGFWTDAEGPVQRILDDDLEGSRHQRFVIELETGQTLLISHNIDLAKRVPVSVGDRVMVRGEYEWNERGGVIHWTHHDPQGRREGGRIEHQGKVYR